MTERNNPVDLKSRIGWTREVLRALPPLDREDEAMAAIIEGMLKAAELLQEGDTSTMG
jgi:hypothetical protein